jgi:class 3 adenylate cyclase/tetratricopeptide (TPR) repeat protein
MGETRRIVTIVFADVSGSTRLGEELDAEALRRVMGRYFEEMRVILERHGGTVEKFIGDAIMAVFGIPVAHEDDALRAVRAAAEMREHLARLNEELARQRGVTLAVRTGINTGEVVAGDPGEGQFYASGDAVNVAARLEQAAEPGEILLGEQTYRLVRDAVEVEALEPLALKGKSGPIAAYRLLEVFEGSPGLARRFDTPFVGREEELARLIASFERAASERKPVLVTVLGSAGIGKTRVGAELTTQIGERATVLRGRCLAYGEGITFWPLQEIVLSLSERPADAPDPEQATSTEETFWAYRKLFEAVAQERPLVLVFEDIHWAEPALLDLIEHIVAWTKDSPMFVLCLARPEFLDGRPAWPGQRLELEPLSADDSQTIVGALAPMLDPISRTRATQTAEGNPLFLEQLLALAVEDGQEQALPQSIQALLTARLDQLEATERGLLERAAVIGQEFWRDALVHLSPPEAEVSALLQGLVRKRLVRPERSSFPGEDAFRFGHILIRDAAYEGIAKVTRADLHERFAEWLDASDSPYDEITGYHLEQAYRLRTRLGTLDEASSKLAVRAGRRLRDAGGRALTRGDMPGALNLLTRAASLLPATSSERLQLLPALAEAARETGDLARADSILRELITEAEGQGDRSLEALAQIDREYLREYLDPTTRKERVLATAERAIKLFEEAGSDGGLAKAWMLRAQVSWDRCRFAEMEEILERALVHAERAGDRRGRSLILNGIARAAHLGPMPVEEGLRRCEGIHAEARGDPALEAVALAMIGALKAQTGAFDEARANCWRSRAIGEEFGLTAWLAALPLYSGPIELLAGEPAAAESELRAGCDALIEMGDLGRLSTEAGFLAQALYAQGRLEEAQYFSGVCEEATTPDDLVSQIAWRSVRSKALARRGKLGQTEALAREAVALAEETDGLNLHGDALIDLAEVLGAAGRPDEARAVVEHALALYERKGNLVSVARARAALSK